MTDKQDRIEQLDQQIAYLLKEREKELRRSNSLWGSIRSEFINQGNDDETAESWADTISSIVNDWINTKRSNLNQSLLSTGIMPPYTQCLNELAVSLASPGADPPAFTEDMPVQYSAMGREGDENPYANFTGTPRRVSSNVPPPPNQLDLNVTARSLLEGEVIRPKFNAPRPFSELPRVNVPVAASPES